MTRKRIKRKFGKFTLREADRYLTPDGDQLFVVSSDKVLPPEALLSAPAFLLLRSDSAGGLTTERERITAKIMAARRGVALYYTPLRNGHLVAEFAAAAIYAGPDYLADVTGFTADELIAEGVRDRDLHLWHVSDSQEAEFTINDLTFYDTEYWIEELKDVDL